jgi:hypothetical protein
MQDQPPIDQPGAEDIGPPTQHALVREPPEEGDEWMVDELPSRPRRRLLAPLPLTLLGVLLIACGFIGGVLVEKDQSPSSSSTGGGAAALTARFAALRGGAAGSSSTAGSGTSLPGRAGGNGAGAATAGQVSFISNGTLYVATAEGNTVKVTPAPGASVTRTVKSDVKAIHPGEMVLVTGSPGADGAISAESIRASDAGAGGGGLGTLLGGGGGARGAGGARTSGAGAGGAPALFGPGG